MQKSRGVDVERASVLKRPAVRSQRETYNGQNGVISLNGQDDTRDSPYPRFGQKTT